MYTYREPLSLHAALPIWAARDTLTDLRIPFSAAWQVFGKRALPRAIGDTGRCYGDLAALPPLCRGTLVSLVYNRGTGLRGDTRREMAAIKRHLTDGRLDHVPQELESMKRLWPNTPALCQPRTKEAAMAPSGLAAKPRANE